MNTKLINARKEIIEIDEKIKELQGKRKYLEDLIHLYFDSEKYNTNETEKFILNYFWSNAYKNYKDGGFITNDDFIIKNRFNYEIKKLDQIIENNCKNKKRALDIACGNGRYTREFSRSFNEVIGIDLSKDIIDENNKNNKNNKIQYINENFITMGKNNLGIFDFIFVGGLCTYTSDIIDLEEMFKSLINMLNKDGILILREGTKKIGENFHKSINYVSYHRNVNFYKEGFFKDYFYKEYQNYGYSLYHLNKFFTVHNDFREKIEENPFLIEKIVKNYVDDEMKSNHFFLYYKK
ncbi:class I SAM-dependent methyltransferase [Aliarcobacter skirrowii]|nr:class I SAM-dependent methyltransferase [Aliarcobacter skirrowii]